MNAIDSSDVILPGLVSITFRKLSPEEIVSLVTRAGLSSVEWGGDIHVPHGDLGQAARVRGMCADAGIRISAYGSYYRAGGARHEGPQFSAVFETAIELGAPRIRVWAGSIGSVAASAAQRMHVVRDLQRICRLAAAAKVEISLEFHGGTLTDSVESTMQLLADANEPNLTTYWQPPERMPQEQCAEGLRRLLPYVRNLHVFHWWPDGQHRMPLAAGEERWREYFAIAASAPDRRHASLEFVQNDDPDRFFEDAATLLNLLRSYAQRR